MSYRTNWGECSDGCCVFGSDPEFISERRASHHGHIGCYTRPMFEHFTIESDFTAQEGDRWEWVDAASWPKPGKYGIGPIHDSTGITLD